MSLKLKKTSNKSFTKGTRRQISLTTLSPTAIALQREKKTFAIKHDKKLIYDVVN